MSSFHSLTLSPAVLFSGCFNPCPVFCVEGQNHRHTVYIYIDATLAFGTCDIMAAILDKARLVCKQVQVRGGGCFSSG